MEEQGVKVRQHDWRQWTMTPVTPIGTMSDGSPAVVQIQEGDTKIFCFACMKGMTDENKDTECSGEDEGDED